ncbi:MAG: Cna B-type domain-containing protein [Lachnospiraceae bacterium]|nr:Cna B-type domain-containing protein [Lachnospiraceae bacterium]
MFQNNRKKEQYLYKYRDGGILIEYTIDEEPVFGYETTKETTIDGTTVFTNKHIPEKTQRNIGKVWVDGDNVEGYLPKKIIVNLLADGEVVDTAIIEPDENGDWKWCFTDLPKYKDHGKEIKYEINEETIEEYTAILGE